MLALSSQSSPALPLLLCSLSCSGTGELEMLLFKNPTTGIICYGLPIFNNFVCIYGSGIGRCEDCFLPQCKRQHHQEALSKTCLILQVVNLHFPPSFYPQLSSLDNIFHVYVVFPPSFTMSLFSPGSGGTASLT